MLIQVCTQLHYFESINKTIKNPAYYTVRLKIKLHIEFGKLKIKTSPETKIYK